MTHQITFTQSRCGSMHRATCPCGWWALSNSLADVQLQASCHVLDVGEGAAPPTDAQPSALYRALADAGYMPPHEYVRRSDDADTMQEATP